MILPNVFGNRIQKDFTEWLYGSYNEDKLTQFRFLYSLPGVSNYMDYLLDSRADQEYMEHNGLVYSDIHDPRKLRSTSSGATYIGTAYRMISRNLDRLYRD